jgi:uncharacterized protein YuzE
MKNSKQMKLEYDEEVDAAYIYLQFPLKRGEAVKTIELNDNIILDFNENEKLLGIEVLNASKTLNKKTLSEIKAS